MRQARVLMIVATGVVAAMVGRVVQAQPQPPGGAIAYINGNVIDVRQGGVITGATVVMRDGRFVAAGAGQPPAGATVVDLRGKFVVPGLIDAHTHLQSLGQARRALESGVTTVRSASVGSYRDVALRDLVKRGKVLGPDVVAAGIFVSPRLGDDDILADPALADLPERIDTPEALRQLVRINLAHGVDVIKTRGTERAGLPDTDPREQTYDENQLRAVVEEAATKGIPVEAHAHGDEGAQAAVRAGVRSVEHGTYLSDETLQLMKQKGTWLVPTFATVIDLVEPGGDYDNPSLQLRGRHMLPRLRHTVQRAHKMGVRLATGADTSYGPASVTRISHEVAAFVDMGLPAIDALRAATTSAAELLRLEKSTGAIEAGLEADFIVVEGNPLENAVVLQDPLLVVSNGRVALNRLDFTKKR